MPTDPRDNVDEEVYRRYSSSSSMRQPQRLPSIRELFGDVLEQPASPRRVPSSREVGTSKRQIDLRDAAELRTNYTTFRDQHSYSTEQAQLMRSRSALPGSSRATPSAATPYERSNTYPPQGISRHRSTYMDYEYYADSKPVPPDPSSSSHSYDVFMASEEGLVHQHSSSKDDFQKMTKEEAISQSTGKHSCSVCGRRFEKRSHLKNHMTSHSGEKPYICLWPGCGKAFSASSNMRRHQRSHLHEQKNEERMKSE